jgi:septal ring factor EnvC (AmiA/AmiB activator)
MDKNMMTLRTEIASMKMQIARMDSQIARYESKFGEYDRAIELLRAEISALRAEKRSLPDTTSGSSDSPGQPAESMQLSVVQQTQLAKQVMQMAVQPLTRAVAQQIIPVMKQYVDSQHETVVAEMRYYNLDGASLVTAFQKEVCKDSPSAALKLTDGTPTKKYLREGVSLVAAEDADWD